jgi:energy-coupling factor transport system ATP-binding protein
MSGPPITEPRLRAQPIALKEVGHTYQAGTPWARPALFDIDLRIEPGERVLVVGGNGSGKSTLAWILAGLHQPTCGEARLGEEHLADRRDEIGIVVQHTRLQLLRPTVGGELDAFTDDRSAQNRALAALGFASSDRARRIDELSMGQQRRVGLAVQLAREVPVLVLDEPMAGLDRSSRQALAEVTTTLRSTTTMITVTHDLDDSKPLGSRVLHLEAGRLISDTR